MKFPRFLLSAACLFALTLGTGAAAATLTVDPSDPGAYATIGAALADAEEGDTVLVEPATYNEEVVVTQANLTLEGMDLPLIDGGCAESSGILIEADGVTVAGFEITKFEVGIEVKDSEECVVQENVISKVKDGIALDGAVACEVSGNVISVKPGECDAAYDPDEGIQAEDGQDNLISENEIEMVGEEDVGDKGIQTEDVGDEISENVLIGTGGDSIRVDGDETSCIGNYLLASASDGFDVGNDDNYFADNEVVFSGDEGHDVDGTLNTFVGNTAHGNADDALELDSESPGSNTVIGNVCSGDAEGGFDVECPDNVIIDNIAFGNTESGFHLEFFVDEDEVNIANDNILADNVAEANGESGFSLEDVEGNELTDNRAIANDGYGFSDNNSEANTYANNKCADNVMGPSDPPGLCDCIGM